MVSHRKKKDLLTAIIVLNWRGLAFPREFFFSLLKSLQPFVEALSDNIWHESSRPQSVIQVSQKSSLSVTTALSPPSRFFCAVSHPSQLPNWGKHFPNEGVGWESCGEWSVDVTSGIVGHLLFMGRGPVCENKNLAVMLHLVCHKLESYIRV